MDTGAYLHSVFGLEGKTILVTGAAGGMRIVIALCDRKHRSSLSAYQRQFSNIATKMLAFERVPKAHVKRRR